MEEVTTNAIENPKTVWLYLTYPVKSAQKWLSMKDQELDKRKKYDEKDSFEYLTHKIEDLLDLKIEIKGISAFRL